VEVLLHLLSTSALHRSRWTCWRESWLDPSANHIYLDTWNISCLCQESNLHILVIQSLYRVIVAHFMQFIT